MKRQTVQLALTLVVAACSCIAVAWVRAGYAYVVIPPAHDINELPLELGDWTGTDQEIDPRVVSFLEADSQLNRLYTNGSGQAAALHAAIWTEGVDSHGIAPHHPSICYPNAGWTLLKEEQVEISGPDGKSFPISLILMERGDQRVVTAHWFQMGEYRFAGKSDARSVHQQFWGKSEWPPIVKVLLHLPASTINDATPALKDIASRIYAFTSEL